MRKFFRSMAGVVLCICMLFPAQSYGAEAELSFAIIDQSKEQNEKSPAASLRMRSVNDQDQYQNYNVIFLAGFGDQEEPFWLDVDYEIWNAEYVQSLLDSSNNAEHLLDYVSENMAVWLLGEQQDGWNSLTDIQKASTDKPSLINTEICIIDPSTDQPMDLSGDSENNYILIDSYNDSNVILRESLAEQFFGIEITCENGGITIWDPKSFFETEPRIFQWSESSEESTEGNTEGNTEENIEGNSEENSEESKEENSSNRKKINLIEWQIVNLVPGEQGSVQTDSNDHSQENAESAGTPAVGGVEVSETPPADLTMGGSADPSMSEEVTPEITEEVTPAVTADTGMSEGTGEVTDPSAPSDQVEDASLPGTLQENSAEGSMESTTEAITEAATQLPTDTSDNDAEEKSTETSVETAAETLTAAPTETPVEHATESATPTPTQNTTESVSVTSPETPTKIPTEAPTEVPAEAQSEDPAETPTEAPAETSTETLTETETPVPTAIPTETPEISQDPGSSEGTDAVVTPTPEIPDEKASEDPEAAAKKDHLFGAFEGMRGGQMFFLLLLLAIVFGLLFFVQKNPVFRIKSLKKSGSSSEDEDTLNYEDMEASSPNFIVESAVTNSKGRIRGNNEDNFYLNGNFMQREKMDEGASIMNTCEDGYQLYAVCDGMGGADCGEEASYRAVKELAVRRKNMDLKLDPKDLPETLQEISDKINKEAVSRGQKSGTTIVLLQMKAEKILLANVGDSRIYRMRNQKLVQLSRDHSRVQRMISMGLLTPEQARKDPARHVITQYLGMANDVKLSPFILPDQEMKSGDIYLLCSDGLTDMVEDAQIEAILKKNKNVVEAVRELLKTALENGGKDNVTIMVLRMNGRNDQKGKQNILGFLKSHIFTIAQILVGIGLVVSILDYIYYLF